MVSPQANGPMEEHEVEKRDKEKKSYQLSLWNVSQQYLSTLPSHLVLKDFGLYNFTIYDQSQCQARGLKVVYSKDIQTLSYNHFWWLVLRIIRQCFIINLDRWACDWKWCKNLARIGYPKPTLTLAQGHHLCLHKETSTACDDEIGDLILIKPKLPGLQILKYSIPYEHLVRYCKKRSPFCWCIYSPSNCFGEYDLTN